MQYGVSHITFFNLDKQWCTWTDAEVVTRLNKSKYLPVPFLCKHHQVIKTAAYLIMWTRSWLQGLDWTAQANRSLETFLSALFTSLTLCTVPLYFTFTYTGNGLTFCSDSYTVREGNRSPLINYSQNTILDSTIMQVVLQSIIGQEQLLKIILKQWQE